MMSANLLRTTVSRPDAVQNDHRVSQKRSLPNLSASAWLGTIIVLLLIFLAIFGSYLVSDPDKQVLRDRLLPPMFFGGTWEHPLGTDQLGRDLLARVVVGCRVTLLLALVVTSASMAIGTLLGLLGGLRTGRVDRSIGFLVDVQIALPVIVVAIAASALFQPGFFLVFLVLLSTGWVSYQRVVRLQARALNQSAFVEASRTIGGDERWILRKHLLPHLNGTVAVLATQQMAAVILFEAALSYLGLGMPPGAITWGRMVADGRETMLTAWWVSVVPGIFIVLAVLGFNLMGEWFAKRHPASRM